MTTKNILVLSVLSVSTLLRGQSATQRAVSIEALTFLEGTWEAKTPAGSAGPAASGTYSFRKELNGHVLARHSSSDSCKGPADFDCDHHDLLYVYQDATDQPLQAIYFDNEGHVIHYDVFTSGPLSAVFMSRDSVPGPRFRLLYNLRDGLMSGKFQMQMPGQNEWKSYLQWTGSKR